MPLLRHLEPEDDEDWGTSPSASPSSPHNSVEDKPSVETNPEIKPTNPTAIRFESLPPSSASSPSPADGINPLFKLPKARAEEWFDSDSEERDPLDQESGVDFDEDLPHVGSDLGRVVFNHSAASVFVNQSHTEPNDETISPEPSHIPRQKRKGVQDLSRFAKDPSTKHGKHRILAADSQAVWRLKKRLNKTKGWRDLTEEEKRDITSRERIKLMQERFENGQSWDYWSGRLPPATDSPPVLEQAVSSRPDTFDSVEDDGQHYEADSDLLSKFIGDDDDDDSIMALEPDVPEGSANIKPAPSRRKYISYPTRKKEKLYRKELQNYIFLAACVQHAPAGFKPDFDAVAKELGMSVTTVQKKIRILKSRLSDEGAEFGNYL